MSQAAARCYVVAALAAGLALLSTTSGQERVQKKRDGVTESTLPAAPAAPVIPRLGPIKPGEPAAKRQREAPPTEQIAKWIHALDADEFLDRETAMLGLMEAGPAVLPALKPVLAGGSLEATSRAFFVVRQLGLAADEETQDEAAKLLSDLASRDEAPALARRAAGALAELTQQRSARALAELEGLGAKISRSQSAAGLFFEEPVLSVEIGDAFQGDEHDLRRLKWISEAPELLFIGQKVTDGWIKHAATMPGLKELHLYQVKISEAGLAALTEHSTLQELGIYYTAVGDGALAPLVKLPLLSFVKLYGTKVSEEAVEKYKEASGVAIDCRKGAFLGVGVQDTETCRISTVHADSPAAKAGLLRDDVIVRFDSKPVRTFENLTDLIRRCDVGDEVEIDVARPTIDDQGNLTLKPVKTRLRFAPWDVEPAVKNSRR